VKSLRRTTTTTTTDETWWQKLTWPLARWAKNVLSNQRPEWPFWFLNRSKKHEHFFSTPWGTCNGSEEKVENVKSLWHTEERTDGQTDARHFSIEKVQLSLWQKNINSKVSTKFTNMFINKYIFFSIKFSKMIRKAMKISHILTSLSLCVKIVFLLSYWLTNNTIPW